MHLVPIQPASVFPRSLFIVHEIARIISARLSYILYYPDSTLPLKAMTRQSHFESIIGIRNRQSGSAGARGSDNRTGYSRLYHCWP